LLGMLIMMIGGGIMWFTAWHYIDPKTTKEELRSAYGLLALSFLFAIIGYYLMCH